MKKSHARLFEYFHFLANSFLLNCDNKMKKTLVMNYFLVLDRYVTAGAAWFNGAFSKVAKAGHVAGAKTREKFHLAVSNLTTKVDSYAFLYLLNYDN